MTDKSETALVVIDDDPDVLRATARVLMQAGYKVITGVSAAEALELTRRHLPAILLLDVMLPDGNGVGHPLRQFPGHHRAFYEGIDRNQVDTDCQAQFQLR
jgi:DNA-binding NtrC family response regulator